MNAKRIRFLTDEDTAGSIASGLRRRAPLLDILTAPEAGTLGWPDPQVLAYGAAQGRILITHDESTMPVHFASFLAEAGTSPGVIITPQTNAIGKVIDDILLIWDDDHPEEWRGLITWLPL